MQRCVKYTLALWLFLTCMTASADVHALGFLVALVLGGIAYASAVIAGFSALVAFKLALVSVFGSALLSALSKPEKIDLAQRGFMSNTRAPSQEHQWVYGRCRVGGAIVYEEATDDNKFLWRVIVLANHEVHSIGDVYAWDERLTINAATGEVSGGVYTDTRTRRWSTGTRRNDDYQTHSETIRTSDKMWVWKFPNGRDPTFPGFYTTDELAKVSNLWTANHHYGSDTAYLIVKMKFDIDAYPSGPPIFTADVWGRKVYDPRTGTTAWSDNWALCVRDFLVSHPATKDFIEVADVTNAANISDELVTLARGGTQKRYTINGALPLKTINDILPHMLAAGAGDAWFSGGKVVIKPGVFDYGTRQHLTEDDFISPINVGTANTAANRFNQVRGRFRGAATQWQESDYPIVSSDAFYAQDNDIRSTANIDLPFCTDPERCQRIAKIMMYRSREELTVQVACNMKAFDFEVGDEVTVDYPRFGWNLKRFEVREWALKPSADDQMAIALTLMENSEDVYEWDADETEFQNNNTRLADPYAKVPVGISWREELRILNQEVFGILIVTLSTETPERVATYEVEIETEQNQTWHALGSGAGTQYEYQTLTPGFVSIRARTITPLGVKGEWEYRMGIAVDLLADPPEDVTGFRHTGTAEHLHLNWNPVSNLDLSHYEIRHIPSTTGEWRDADTTVAKVGRPATGKSLPHRTGKYFIKAIDKLGFESVNAATLTVTAETTQYFEIANEWPADQNWNILSNGNQVTYDGFDLAAIVDDEILTLQYVTSTTFPVTAYWPQAGPYTTPPYEFRRIDLGATRTALIRIDLKQDVQIVGTGTFDTLVGNIDSWLGDWDDLITHGNEVSLKDNTTISAEIRAADTQAGLLTATWEPFLERFITARYIIVRLKFTSENDLARPRALALKIAALIPFVTETGRDVQSTTAGAGLIVNFSAPFYEPPAVMITPLNLDRWDFYNVTNVTNTSFTIRFRTSGYAVINRRFNWTAYGAR